VDQPEKQHQSSQPAHERKPWPMKYIAMAIVFFILLFNLYLLLFGGGE